VKRKSIRFRLTVWYTAVLAVALLGFAGFSSFAVEWLLLHVVDEELEDRAEGVHKFLREQTASLSVEEIRDEFKEHSVLGPGGDLFQVCDAQGVWLYRSASLEDAEVPIEKPAELPQAGQRVSRSVKRTSVRFLSRPVSVSGKAYTVQVGALTGEIEEGLSRFREALVVLVPLVLGIAALGGWWMSRRALAPVDAIATAARSIGERNLNQRLPAPGTNDELDRLSATLNQMLERIDSAFQRVTQFTADASHELRTPVALMRTTAELALRKRRDDADYRQALQEILDESERTTGLVENLLTLARADAGKATIERLPVDAAGLLLEVSEQAGKLAVQKGISFEHVPMARGTKVAGDAATLRRLLLILLDNALKYTPPGGRVSLGATVRDGCLAVEIKDSGVGIPEEDLPHIFERFYRADKSRNRDTGGAGLGLSLARWIVEAHQGQIEVRSRVDEGSVFRVELPVEAKP
jgi:heavy metal sensor kinase